MRAALILGLLCILIGGIRAGATRREASTGTGIGSTACSTPTFSQVLEDKWVEERVDKLISRARASFLDDSAADAYKRAVLEINAELERNGYLGDSDFVGRHSRFVNYLKTISLEQDSDHELGFDVPDKQYFAETARYVQIPDFLLDPYFVRSVSRWETLARAKAYLRKLNAGRAAGDRLLFFSYTSRHLGTPDNDDSFRRLLIVVPPDPANGMPDKWVQFGVTDPRVRARTRNVSVVSAVRGPDGKFDTYFKDFYRTYRRDGSITIRGRWELGYGDDSCATCHKTGILPIFPEAGSLGAGEEEALEAVNSRFLTYGSPRFGSYKDESALGPGIGSASEASREARFGKGFNETPVGRAMSCSECHAPGGLGALNWPMDPVLINSYITGGQMPLGSDLGKSKRLELYEKLVEEYFSIDAPNPGILKAWLAGR